MSLFRIPHSTFHIPTVRYPGVEPGTSGSQSPRASICTCTCFCDLSFEFGATDSNRLDLLQRQTACACGAPNRSTGSWNRTNGSLSNNQTETPTSPLRFVAMGNSEWGIRNDLSIPHSSFRNPHSAFCSVVRVRFELTVTGF